MKPGVSYTDPVCGMKADDEKLTYTFNGTKYYFCSQEDLETFKSQPDKFVSSL
jgi:YHS domain-containing protein